MWNRACLNDGSEVRWRVSDDAFEVECTLERGNDMPGLRLNICNFVSGKYIHMCLGSFSVKNGDFAIHKVYTLSYLELHNISVGINPDFEITDINGTVICSTYKNKIQNSSVFAENEDYALTRAKDLLSSVHGESADFDIAERVAQSVSDMMMKYERVDLPCFGMYNWIKITLPCEDFRLSAVAHLIYDAEFFRLFQRHGEWFFGILDKRLFAMCIKSEFEHTPFSNAADCSRAESDGLGMFYHAVGIALLDDGQYFFRI